MQLLFELNLAHRTYIGKLQEIWLSPQVDGPIIGVCVCVCGGGGAYKQQMMVNGLKLMLHTHPVTYRKSNLTITSTILTLTT